MINDENSSYYLRYLVKLSNEKGISLDEIPPEFKDYFSIPGLASALNISLPIPPINWFNVETYIDSNTFSDFNSLYQGINNNFNTITEKLYAAYYFITHHITYNDKRNSYGAKNTVPFDEIISDKKGIESDYKLLYIELAKKFGFTSKTIYITKIYDPTSYSHREKIPEKPEFSEEAIFVEIEGVPFISDPYQGSETDKYGKERKKSGKYFF